MKLAACFNTWGDVDLLKLSIENIRQVVEVVIVVYSRQSNFGEIVTGPDGSALQFDLGTPVFFYRMEPNLNLSPRENETNKRNYAIQLAREIHCTHFLSMDADEFYKHDDFLRVKALFSDPSWEANNIKGSVCTCTTFFKRPTLSIGLDVTLVPFIHELTPTIKHEFNKRYPCAWNGNQILIDPTRSYNINTGVVLIRDVTMFHYSWIRKDFDLKIRNSTASANLKLSTILEDLANAKPGYHVKFYNKTLTECENIFNIPNL